MIELVERGWVPDGCTRWGIRRLLRERLREAERDDGSGVVAELDRSPIALAVDAANDQHYEVPAEFYARVLGPHLKYSSCLWEDAGADLGDAEEAMLRLTAERAGVEDGMSILDLGCGWGSLSLWLARRFPSSRVVSVSNSASQRRFIDARCREGGIDRIETVTADMNTFDTDNRFDRIVSVEMFEHMRNYRLLMERIRRWLRPDGKLFVHIFCHRRHTYPYEIDGKNDWMARHFFTGGLMPAYDLLPAFDDHLSLEQRWPVNGEHYRRTALAWLERLDAARAEILPLLHTVYGAGDAHRWLHRWRLFFLAVAELFGYRSGREWFVGHYRFAPRTKP